MNFKTFITIQAVVLAFFGIGTRFMAPTVWGVFGVNIEGHGVFIARGAGTLICANVILSWLFRDVSESKALRAIVYHGLVSWIGMLIVFIIAQLDGTTNSLGWSNVVLSVIFSYAWLHYGFIKPVTKG